MVLPSYEVFAIKYAERSGHRGDRFLGGDPHDSPMSADYYVWLVRDSRRVFLIDTGFDAAMAAKRKRNLVREPHEGLALLGVKAEEVNEVIITHLHNDHVGTFFDFPNAKFHIQDEEMAYATGLYMGNGILRRPYEVDHVVGMVRLVFDNQVIFHKGDEEIAPGLHVHHIGGHTAGLQAVRVHTRRGWVVLASDASHFYENFEKRRPHPIVFSVGQMVDGYGKLHRLADSPRHIIPGHDPLVMRRYPPPSPELKEMIVRLDVDPSE